MGRRLRRATADYAYIAPALSVPLLVIGYPICNTVYLSFFATPPNLAMSQKVFVGFGNYTRIQGSDAFLSVTWNRFLWTFFSTTISFVLGFGAGWPSIANSSGVVCCEASCWSRT